jgi:hypothetical protein
MGLVHPAEVVPVALGVRFIVRALLIPFAALAGYFVAWGLVFVMDAVVRAFFGTATGAVSWIPYAGKVLSTPLLAVEHKLTSFLGGLEQHFEHQMAARWHALAQLVEALAADTKAAAIFDYQLARKVATLWGNAAVGAVTKGVHTIVKTVHAEVHTVTRTVIRVERVVGAKADAVIVHRVGALAGELEHVIDWTIPRLRARERAAEAEIGRLWRRVRTHERSIGIGAFTALLVAALGRLGLGRLTCLNRKNALQTVCRMHPDLLSSLLAGTLVLASPISVVELTRAAQVFTAEAEDALRWFVRELE